MATYLSTNGSRIQNYTTDPDNPNNGEVWYNSTANTLKFQFTSTAGSYTTANSMNTARSNLGSSNSGTQTATIAFGGTLGPPTYSENTETYNGTNWTEVNNLTAARSWAGGFGNYTSALCVSGYINGGPNTVDVEIWNGTNWAETGNVNTASQSAGNAGVDSTAGITYGGFDYAIPGGSNKTELWNGTNWTEVNNLNLARYYLSGNGTSTAAIGAGGETSTFTNDAETWNGTNWTEISNINTARNAMAGFGTSTDFYTSGGNSASGNFQAITERWNGSSWSEENDLNTGRSTSAASGSGTAGLYFAGQNPGKSAVTEEWNAPTTAVKTISTD